MAIFVRSFGLGIGCPTSRYAGQTGTVEGSIRAEIENDSDRDETVSWRVEISDSDENSGSDSSFVYVPARSTAFVNESIFYSATYNNAGSKTATCRGSVASESDSRTCTFTIYSAATMPEVLKNALEQLNT
jgi:hypothetical protein